MRSYGQYCPISRASEILAERWVPIVVRNLLLGARTFTEVLDGAPGMSRTLLSQRLRNLERAGVIEILPNPSGRGSVYELTAAGRDLWDVVIAMGNWATRWTELTQQHADPRVVLWSWSHEYLARDLLPPGRVVVRFDFPDQPPAWKTFWLLFERGSCEVCDRHPGYEETLVVRASSLAFAKWHAGLLEWDDALESGAIEVAGPPDLARVLPRWNMRSRFAPTP
ncbi:MAG TPA: helix-turn-helix domain-containing protein [Actinomycetota bacterium]|nr:helix-turn-helix domain-containing protein [Actinomycetota bacterium]